MKVEEAIAICKASGYAVIPREKIMTVHTTRTVEDMALYQFRDEPNFPAVIVTDLLASLARYMQGKGVVKLDRRRAGDLMTEFEATLTVIPHEIETDPFLEAMRAEDRGKE